MGELLTETKPVDGQEKKKIIATVERKGKQIVVTPVDQPEEQTEEDKVKNEEKLGKHLLVEG